MNNDCTSQSDKRSCELLERPRYFPRQLISDVDMTLDQVYFRNKLRLHNRMLHGWGVVCGAIVCRVPGSSDSDSGDCDNGESKCDGYKPWKVVVKRGYILGPYGDEIVIGCEHEVDLRSAGVSGVSGESTEHLIDPWCCEGTVKREPGCYWIAVKYNECMTRAVRVQPVGCGCDETQCEYSRWRDGYEIGILDECPETHLNPPEIPTLPEFKEFYHEHVPCCPPCPEEPWVVLAKVCVDDDGCVTLIDNCSCRRLVFSFSHLWWKCTVAAHTIEKVEVGDGTPATENPILTPGLTVTAIITGTHFSEHMKARFGPGVILMSFEVNSAEQAEATIQVTKEATPGTLKIIDPCGAVAALDYGITETPVDDAGEAEAARVRPRAKKAPKKPRRTKR